jgi:APA family basic amino acid/polyamine antiporter
MNEIQGSNDETPLQSRLGLWDAICIIIGIVIGSSIFKTPPIIFQNLTGPWIGIGVWLLCGLLSLVGALCYAELATTYPRSGGDYVYLTRAFGRPVGFLFGWAQLVVILSGSTGMMAFIFGEYLADLLGVASDHKPMFATQAAVAAVVILSGINLCGVVLGKWVQNLLVTIKLVGLAAIVVVGISYGRAEGWSESAPAMGDFGVALILVLYAYGGWNDAAFVAADMKDRRLIPRALILSILSITLIYVAVNAAYIFSLGFHEARNFRPTIAADVFRPLGEQGFRAMCILVMVSALGAMNGLIFTGSRVYSSLGAEHSVFALLGRWHPRLHTPAWALLVQAGITLAMIFVVGTAEGRGTVNQVLTLLNFPEIPWDRYFGGFDTLFAGTAPVFWTFFLLTGISFFILRKKDPNLERPFRLQSPWYPILPMVFCGMCLFGLYSAVTYAKYVALIGWIPLALGVPLFMVSRSKVRVES